MIVVYLLQNPTGKTYVGSTINLAKRLRQHNNEIVGGAIQTRGRGPWVVICQVTGFESFNEALKFEFAWRRCGKRIRNWSEYGRRKALEKLQEKKRWSSTSPLACERCLTVDWTIGDSGVAPLELMANETAKDVAGAAADKVL